MSEAHINIVACVDGEIKLVEAGYPYSVQVNWRDFDDVIASTIPGVTTKKKVYAVAALREAIQQGKADAPLASPVPFHMEPVRQSRGGEKDASARTPLNPKGKK